MSRYTATWADAATSAHGMHPRQGGYVAVQRTDGATMTDDDLTRLLRRFAAAGVRVRHAWDNGYGRCFALDERPTDEQLAQVTNVVELPRRSILITRRSSDFHACIDGHPEIWGAGKTHYEAVGSLVLAHLGHFGMDSTI